MAAAPRLVAPARSVVTQGAVGAGWRAHAGVAYQAVFTHRRIEQMLLSAGVSRTFPMPSWLRDFLD